MGVSGDTRGGKRCKKFEAAQSGKRSVAVTIRCGKAQFGVKPLHRRHPCMHAGTHTRTDVRARMCAHERTHVHTRTLTHTYWDALHPYVPRPQQQPNLSNTAAAAEHRKDTCNHSRRHPTARGGGGGTGRPAGEEAVGWPEVGGCPAGGRRRTWGWGRGRRSHGWKGGEAAAGPLTSRTATAGPRRPQAAMARCNAGLFRPLCRVRYAHMGD